MNSPIHVLLADDDLDDCNFFHEALEELPLSTTLITVNDGVQLLQQLSNSKQPLPDVLFLDLNMPRQNGVECLATLKKDEKLKKIPVVIYSTSFIPDVINLLYENGADYYIRKPGDFSKLKNAIHEALKLTQQHGSKKPAKENFVIQP